MPLNLTIYLDTADNVLSVRHAVDFNELGRGFLGVFIAQRLPLTKLGDLEFCISGLSCFTLWKQRVSFALILCIDALTVI